MLINDFLFLCIYTIFFWFWWENFNFWRIWSTITRYELNYLFFTRSFLIFLISRPIQFFLNLKFFFSLFLLCSNLLGFLHIESHFFSLQIQHAFKSLNFLIFLEITTSRNIRAFRIILFNSWWKSHFPFCGMSTLWWTNIIYYTRAISEHFLKGSYIRRMNYLLWIFVLVKWSFKLIKVYLIKWFGEFFLKWVMVLLFISVHFDIFRYEFLCYNLI